MAKLIDTQITGSLHVSGSIIQDTIITEISKSFTGNFIPITINGTVYYVPLYQ